MPLLVVERGNDKGLTVKVEAGKAYVVGRDNPQAAVKIQDPLLSRVHFEIRAMDGGVCSVRDRKSRNGTLLNDEKLDPDRETPLRIGDKLQAGETIFSFLSDEKEEAPGGLIGKVIGGYRLLERVGRGGMGTVYKAEQMSLNRQVALKVLSSKLMSDPTFVERFVQEAKSAGGLNHPNIVSVFDVGSDRGIHYFSMEFMEYGSVGDIVARDGPVPWERALEMLTDAGRGLIFAEKRGIVHRDIKPDNLMLTSEGIVKIGDLGLAKKAEDVSGDGGGQIFGTPHFIAPEQAQGKPVDHRADIYALGATFYRVLSGKTPFSGENVKEILVKQVREEPPPLARLVPDLPSELALVVGKMMKKNPDDRYRSAQGLVDDLESIRVRYHLEAHGQAASARRTKVIAGVLLVAVVGLGGAVYHFATKKNITIINNPDRPDKPDRPDNPPPPDPEKIRREESQSEFLQVKNEDLELGFRLKGGPKETWKKHEEEWFAVATRYEAIAKKFEGAPVLEAATASAARAKEIRGAVETAKREDEARTAAASKALGDLLARVDALLAGRKYHEAAERLAFEGAALLADREKAAHLPDDAEKTLHDRMAAILAAARAEAAPLLSAIEVEAPKYPGTGFWGVWTGLRDLRGRVAPPRNAKPFPESPEFASLAKRIRDAMIASLATAVETAREVLDADRAAFFRTYLEIRRWIPSSAEASNGGGVEADGGPFFDYRWDEALAKWKALRGTLRTVLYVDRVDRKIAHYERCRRLFAAIAGKIRNREISNPGFPDSVKKGTNVVLDSTLREEATAERFAVLRLPSRQKAMVEFREMTPREIYEQFLNGGEGFSAEEHLDLSVFLAEAGVGDHAWTELTAATVATPPAKVDPALKTWIEGESLIWNDVHGRGGIEDLLRAYEKAREGGLRLPEVEKLRREIETRLDALEKEERFFTTDYYILNRSDRGPEGPVPDRLFPDDATRGLVRSLGVPGMPPPAAEKDGTEEPGETESGKGDGTDGGSPPADGGDGKAADGDGTEKKNGKEPEEDE